MLINRSFDNTNRGNFHILNLEDGETNPLRYRGAKFPINLLNTYNLLVNPTQVLIKDASDNQYYNVLHANSELQVVQNNQNVGQVKKGSPAVVGDNLNIQQSPAPFCYIDKTGALNSVVSSNPVWSESVMGYVAQGKPNTYSQGFVREGNAIHGNQFLRKDGQWAQVSQVFTGTVSETFLSLNDTPVDYNNHLDKYLRVSYANGGRIVFDAIDTSKVPENTNLYYTDARVNTRIDAKCADRTIPELKIQNTITCNSIITDSDRKLKENFRTLKPSEALNGLSELKPVTYNFKRDAKKVRRSGFIADEVLPIFPDVATETTINYIDLIPHLVGAIQSLKLEVESLKNELKSHLDI